MLDFNKAFAEAKSILTRPTSSWQAIATKIPLVKETQANLVFPFIFAACFADFIHALFFSKWGIEGGYAFSVLAISSTVYLLDLYISSLVVNEIGKSYGYGNHFNKAFTLVSYAKVPTWTAYIVFNLFPALWPVLILTFYPIYLLAAGIKHIYTPHPEHRTGITIGVILSVLIIGVVLETLGYKVLHMLYITQEEGLGIN